MRTPFALLVCITSALSSLSHAQSTASISVAHGVTTLDPVNAPYAPYIYQSHQNIYVGENWAFQFWDTDWQQYLQYYYNSTSQTVVESCALLAATVPEGCNSNVLAYLGAGFGPVPNANQGTACWFGCNSSVSRNFVDVVEAGALMRVPIHNIVMTSGNNLNQCYSSPFNNPFACEQQYLSQLDQACNDQANFYRYSDIDLSPTPIIDPTFILARQEACRVAVGTETVDIGEARSVRDVDPYYTVSSSIALALSGGVYNPGVGLTLVEITVNWDLQPNFNKAFADARKVGRCKAWAQQASDGGCFGLI